MSQDCRWLNYDGTLGCNGERALHFDHKYGSGSAAGRGGKEFTRQVCYAVLDTCRHNLCLAVRPYAGPLEILPRLPQRRLTQCSLA
jgi:hypothetical protein